MPVFRIALLLALLLAPAAAAPEADPGLFERGVTTLREHWPEAVAPVSLLDELVARHRPALGEDPTPARERAALFALLADVPTSHLALFTASGARRVMRVLAGREVPGFGFELARLDAGFFVFDVLEGGPADRAGLRRGELVTAIDGVPVAGSPRLDWRSDDAFLPDWPRHFVDGQPGDTIRLTVERRPVEARVVEVACEPLSPLAVDRAAVRVVPHRGLRLGYLRLRYMYARGAVALVRDALAGPLAAADGLVLDLRGRGGSVRTLRGILALLVGPEAAWRRPVAVLVDRNTRSAKEVLAWELARRDRAVLVGERTAGAVRPATFFPAGDGARLLIPVPSRLEAIAALERKGVAPDVRAADPLAWAAGADPILAAGLDELARRCAF